MYMTTAAITKRYRALEGSKPKTPERALDLYETTEKKKDVVMAADRFTT
jgi:hypothetical protein